MFLLLQALEVRRDVCFPVARCAEDLVTVGAGERTDTWGGKKKPPAKRVSFPPLLTGHEEFAN